MTLFMYQQIVTLLLCSDLGLHLVTRILFAGLAWANQYLPRTPRQVPSHVLAANRAPKPPPGYATLNPLGTYPR